MSVLLRTGLVLLAGMALGLVANVVHPAGVPLRQPVWAQAEVGQCSAGEGAQGGAKVLGPEAVSPQQAQSLLGQPGVVIGDLRPAQQYAEGHIAGAIHLPCTGTLGLLALDKIRPGTQLLIYDGDGRSPQLQTAAATAAIRGMGQVYTLQGGFAAWLAAGLPAESGTCDRCGKS